MSFLIKAVAIYAKKKESYYCQINDRSGKLLYIKLK